MDKKKIILVVLLLAVVCVVLFFVFGKKEIPQTVIQTEKVEVGSLVKSVTATGTVEPVTEVEVGTQVSGKIDRIYVDYNSKVKKGQLLAELDRSTLTSTLNAAKTDYEIALNEYKYYEKVYKRNKTLHDKALISDSEFEEVEYKYVKAKNSVTKSKYEVDKAQTNLGYATIYSPIDGIVVSVEVEEGQTVTASMTTPTLFYIAENLEDMEVVANIDEADIGEVAEGQRVEFTVDAYPDDKFEGKVRQVRLQATTTSNVVTYEVIVDAKNPDLKLKPGLTANISVHTIDKRDVLTISNKAFKVNLDEKMLPPGVKKGKETSVADGQKGKCVWVLSGDSAVQRLVEVGATNGMRSEVVSGLSEGDMIAMSSIETQELTPQDMQKDDKTSSPFMPQRPGQRKKK